jgi:hypothetical protein
VGVCQCSPRHARSSCAPFDFASYNFLVLHLRAAQLPLRNHEEGRRKDDEGGAGERVVVRAAGHRLGIEGDEPSSVAEVHLRAEHLHEALRFLHGRPSTALPRAGTL